MSLAPVELAVLAPLIGAVVVGALPRSEPVLARALAVAVALIELVLLARLIVGFDAAGELVQARAGGAYLPGLGVEWSLGVDGGALWWLILIALVAPLALLTGGPSRPGEPPLMAGALALEAASVAVVLARDLVTLAVAWEFVCVVSVILLGARGDGRGGVPGRISAARRHAALSLAGAAALLGLVVVVGVAYAHAHAGVQRWDLDALSSVTLPEDQQSVAFGFALVVALTSLPLIPLHIALAPLCRSGPTPAVALVLGVGMPLGLFLVQRIALPLVPLALGAWADPIAALAVAGAIYAGLACWAEREPARLLAHVALLHTSLAVVAVVSGSAAASLALGPYIVAHGLGLTILTAVCHALRRDGVNDLAALTGWLELAPRSFLAALAGALIVIGAPITAGFVGGLGIVAGVVAEGQPGLQHPGVWALLGAGALGIGGLGLLRTLWLSGRGVPRPASETWISELGLRERVVVVAAALLGLAFGLAPAPISTRSEASARAASETYALRRCLAIEARLQPRPRKDAELTGICLDPRARIRQYYGLAGAPDVHGDREGDGGGER